jgi:hypothetical protein
MSEVESTIKETDQRCATLVIPRPRDQLLVLSVVFSAGALVRMSKCMSIDTSKAGLRLGLGFLRVQSWSLIPVLLKCLQLESYNPL